jgi:hypothetical protein
MHLLRRAAQRVRQFFDPFELHRDEPVPYAWFTADEVSRFDHAPGERIDDQTWRDLELQRYVDQVAQPLSIFGRQVLVHRLRSGRAAAGRADTVLALQTSALAPAIQPALEQARHTLRRVDCEIAGLLFADAPAPLPSWLPQCAVVPVALLLALVIMALGWLAVGGVLLLLALTVSAWVQIKLHAPLRLWHSQKQGLLAMLRAGRTFAQAAPHPLLAHAAAQHNAVQRLLKAFGPRPIERLPALVEYANLLALYQYRRLGTEIALLARERAVLQAVFRCVADTEVHLALHAHVSQRAAQPTQPLCWASPVEPGARQLSMQGLVNPLLPDAQPLDLRLFGHSAFVTGQNGVGKSTLLRGVGLNLVVAQAFGFCYARACSLPAAVVHTSLQIEDSLEQGHSLFVAEVRRAQQLLRLAQFTAQGGLSVMFIIDEIFRGTNHLESVSAAAAVLHELAQHALVLVSSHNLVLAPLLVGDFKALCVTREGARTGSGDSPALCLVPGVLAHTNGLALMAEMGLAQHTAARASGVFDWLAATLTQPPNCPALGPLGQRLN